MAATTVTQINPDTLGPAIAPYSQATVAGGFVFIAGQVALDRENKVIAPGDVKQQTTAALERIGVILEEVGASLSDITTATVYLTDVALFSQFNEAWAAKLGDHRPARATVRADLLLDGLVVEIQAIAALPGS